MQRAMKNAAKLIVIAVFGVFVVGLIFNTVGVSKNGSRVFAQANGTPTPAAVNSNATPANTTVKSNTAANSNAAKPEPSAAGGKEIPKTFALSMDSQSEYGEVAFNHENHAFKMYSVDGKSVMGCAECHHTDQPKSALRPPLSTSERDVVLTLDVFKASNQKVSDCRACHFQENNVPDGKEMPSATYTEGGKSTTKELTNELAYHINCNTCHDSAFKLRPELKSKPGFSTSKDCTVCHKSN